MPETEIPPAMWVDYYCTAMGTAKSPHAPRANFIFRIDKPQKGWYNNAAKQIE
jgi:hypothetical protein